LKKTLTNVVADCLSRSTDINVLVEEMDPLDWRTMNDEQSVDPVTMNLANSNDHSLDLKYITIPGTQKQLLGDVSQG